MFFFICLSVFVCALICFSISLLISLFYLLLCSVFHCQRCYCQRTPLPQKRTPSLSPKGPPSTKKYREKHFPNQLWKRHVLCRKFPAGNNSKRLWKTFCTKVPRETFYTTSDLFFGGLSVVSLWSLSRLSVVSLSVLSVLYVLLFFMFF